MYRLYHLKFKFKNKFFISQSKNATKSQKEADVERSRMRKSRRLNTSGNGEKSRGMEQLRKIVQNTRLDQLKKYIIT